MFFKKKRSITIQDTAVSIVSVSGEDYISLTDMTRGQDGDDHIRNWMRNRNTVEFLGLWESINNHDFKGVGFDTFKKEVGLNSFNMTPRKWIEGTNAKGIMSKSGRGGGTYAHRDIAFEFGTWISPTFKLYLIKEYQHLKEIESNEYNHEWNVKRILSKTNYLIQTDAVKNHIIPNSKKWRQGLEYADEADILNVALFGCTAKEWRNANPDRNKSGENIRDMASINELIVLSNLESMNADMMREGIDKKTRLGKLRQVAEYQTKILDDHDPIKGVKKSSDDIYLIESKKKNDG